MKNQKGITLIALVITIIVLLILAGVSIAMLTGENGILNQATEAKEDTQKAEVVERINMELSALKSKMLAGDAIVEADATAMQKNLGNGYTVEFTAATTGETATPAKITVTAVPTTIATMGSIEGDGTVVWAVAEVAEDAEDAEGGE